MSAFLIILGVPFLGVLLWLTDQARRTGQTPRARSVGRIGVLLCGAAAGTIGGIVLLNTVSWIVFDTLEGSMLLAIVTFLAQTLSGLLLLWAGRCAWHVWQLPPSSFADPADPHRERLSEQLRLSATMLMLVPLLLLGVFGVMIAVPLILWGVAFRTMRLGRQVQFLWTLALATKQNLPLPEEIEMFAEPLSSRQREKYRILANRLRDGRSLGESLELSSGILSRAVASEIRMAEDAGRLPGVLSELATGASTSLVRNRVDRSVAITILYGWLLLSTFLVVAGFLMYAIIPKYKSIFSDFGVDLPPLTLSVIHASNTFVDNFLLVLPMIALPLLGAFALSIIYFVNWDYLNLPLLMRWFPRLDAPALLRTLAHPVGAGSPLPHALDEMSHRHLRGDVRLRLSRMSDSLQRGEPLWASLSAEGFIRPVEAEALAAAQRAGNLPWAMRTLAESMDRTVQRRTLFWLEIIKPALVIGLGLIVGWFVIAMFLPLLQLIFAIA